MTPTQIRWVAAASILATVVVLIDGGRGTGDNRVLAAAQRNPVTVAAALPPAAAAPLDPGGTASGSGGGALGGGSGGGFLDDGAGSLPAGGSLGNPGGTPPSADTEEPKPSKIKHVFVIALAGHGFDAAFGPDSAAPYLSGELRAKGALLDRYGSLGRGDLADLIAMVGGQPPNSETAAGCPTFAEMPTTAPSKGGVIAAPGCVFPNTVITVADQLTASGRTWRAYVEDIERGPRGDIKCRRPDSNALDDTARARLGDGYATRHNPFVYFHSLLDLGDCDASDGSLAALDEDLASVKKTPNLAWIAPNLCNDGTEDPCVDGSPGGIARADAFLAAWVPKILESPAYTRDGLLVVTFAGGEAPAGTLLVSRFANAGSTAGARYDPYSLLRSLEDLFALRPLAKAARASSFADTVLAEASVGPVED